MKILYVGFKGIHNSSNKLVNHICGERTFLTNSFNGLKRDIQEIDDNYDFVYMFGLDKTLKDSVRIEKCAEKSGNDISTKADTEKIMNELQKSKVKCIISEKPTHYLCNEAYYYIMNRMKCPVVFIHIPTLKYLTDDMLQEIAKAMYILHS